MRCPYLGLVPGDGRRERNPLGCHALRQPVCWFISAFLPPSIRSSSSRAPACIKCILAPGFMAVSVLLASWAHEGLQLRASAQRCVAHRLGRNKMWGAQRRTPHPTHACVAPAAGRCQAPGSSSAAESHPLLGSLGTPNYGRWWMWFPGPRKGQLRAQDTSGQDGMAPLQPAPTGGMRQGCSLVTGGVLACPNSFPR